MVSVPMVQFMQFHFASGGTNANNTFRVAVCVVCAVVVVGVFPAGSQTRNCRNCAKDGDCAKDRKYTSVLKVRPSRSHSL